MKIPKFSTSKGFAFLKFIRFLFAIITVGSLIFGTIDLWQQHNNFEPIVKEIGGKIFNPLYNLSEHIKSISTEGLWGNEGVFFKDLWQLFKNIWLIIEPIFLVYYLFFWIYKFSEKMIIMDDSRKFNSFLVSSIIYFLISLLYVAIFTDLPLKTPFSSMGEIFRALGSFFN